MNSGSRKDAPRSVEPSQPLDNDLLTSEDLFGDLVDEPAKAPPVQVARRPPIKVQLAEGPQGLGERTLGLGSSDAADLVLDALDPVAPPDPGLQVPTRAPRSNRPSAPRGDPGSPLTGHGREFESLLDNFGPELGSDAAGSPEAEAPVPSARVGAAVAGHPEPLPSPVPAGARQSEIEELLQASSPDPAPLLDPSGTDVVKPVARISTRFSARPPEPGSGDALLDLSSLADQALGALTPAATPAGGRAAAARARPKLAQSGDFGPYRLLERIAVGGMAEVFRAKRAGVEGFEKILAVKRILAHLSDNQEFVDMFVHEAKMVAGLTHPNIVQIFDLGKLEDSYYIAMEYVHGRDLRSIQKRATERGARIPLDLAALIVSKVCSALEFAHRKKDERGRPLQIVHRDVSPQNILISFEGDVKLTDFGIAKAESKATITDRGALRGKLLYMSPEQAWGQAIDKRADIFSLGVVFYELVTGQKPFLSNSEGSILDAVRECRVAPPASVNPRIPEKLGAVVMKALDRNPDQRYQDASDFYRDLDRVLQERQVPAAPELARMMSVLFDERERGDIVAEESSNEVSIELELHDEKPQAAVSQDPEIDKLLKRFGIQ